MKISVIIPAFNEEKHIKACIKSAKNIEPFEIIVVDGSSTDKTKELAKEEGVFVIQSPKGRGIQMNIGASIANGDILLFLHADSVITNRVDIRDYIAMGYIGGFFRLRFNDSSISTKLVEFFANLRARMLSLPYGDQAIFIKNDLFKKIGGFKEYPFLEDIEFVRRLKKFGKLRYIQHNVIASSRRIQKGYPFSPILISMRNALIVLFFMLGVSPHTLLKFYR
ncbi:glycosyl transferase [Dissulfurispira thermophila]|uniref:Glycosyl transferase n=1 Tax=Dissulfurispira thermophila TaxID=2715679 RepID=A0A7G1H354_9BACT|nr:TIGR04283 family arsenosugar biosynthesis glycosyltransferase [Dissulfurispira thermophila]BCB96553.1 glycosyl transferase [Dissulfurispira thermophila]